MLRNRVASENGVIGLFVFLHIQQYAILVVLFVFLDSASRFGNDAHIPITPFSV